MPGAASNMSSNVVSVLWLSHKESERIGYNETSLFLMGKFVILGICIYPQMTSLENVLRVYCDEC